MQLSVSRSFGVSPAFLLSCYGESFGPEDVERALPRIADLGFRAYQPEVFDAARLDDWTPAAAARVATVATDNGVAPSAFVAHFFGETIASVSALSVTGAAARANVAVFDRVCELAVAVGTSVVVVPALPFGDGEDGSTRVRPRLVEFFATLLDRSASAGVTLAVETVPGSLIPTASTLAELDRALGGGRIGYLCDTGNALAAGEPPDLAVRRMARVVATHICDTRAGAGSSECPGSGDVEWPVVLAALAESGFEGSLDIEIRCPEAEVDALYTRALEFLAETLAAIELET